MSRKNTSTSLSQHGHHANFHSQTQALGPLIWPLARPRPRISQGERHLTPLRHHKLPSNSRRTRRPARQTCWYSPDSSWKTPVDATSSKAPPSSNTSKMSIPTMDHIRDSSPDIRARVRDCMSVANEATTWLELLCPEWFVAACGDAGAQCADSQGGSVGNA